MVVISEFREDAKTYSIMSVPDVLLLIISKLNSARALPSSSACYILDMDIWTEELAEKSS